MTMNADPIRDQADQTLRQAMAPARRIVILNISPSVDGGRYPAKRCEGDQLTVEADIFADGHEKLAARLVLREPGRARARTIPMNVLGNDRWRAQAQVGRRGLWQFTIQAWIDVFGGFARDTAKKREARLPLSLEAEEGRLMIADAAKQARGAIKTALLAILDGWPALSESDRIALLLAPETREAMAAADAHPHLVESGMQQADVERKRAGFASWYELFPRSQGEKG